MSLETERRCLTYSQDCWLLERSLFRSAALPYHRRCASTRCNLFRRLGDPANSQIHGIPRLGVMPLDARLGESEERREVDEDSAFRLLRGGQSGMAAEEYDCSRCSTIGSLTCQSHRGALHAFKKIDKFEIVRVSFHPMFPVRAEGFIGLQISATAN